MLNFFARPGPEIEKIDSLCQGEGSEMDTEKEPKNSQTRRMTAYPYKGIYGTWHYGKYCGRNAVGTRTDFKVT
jgi:hypothetical protein